MKRIDLNPSQRAAAERLGQDVCVVAGPGSGKTRVLAERFGWLVAEQKVEPGRILAITFTEKATNEIKKRLADQFADDAVLRRKIERAPVSTIHGYCARLLRERAVTAGLDPDFQVLDEATAAPMAKQAARAALDELARTNPGLTGRLIEALHVSRSGIGRQPDLAQSLIDAHEALRMAAGEAGGSAPDGPGLKALVTRIRAALADGAPWRSAVQQEERARLLEWTARTQSLASAEVSAEHFRAVHELAMNFRRVPQGLRPVLDEVRARLVPAVLSTLVTRFHAPLRQAIADLEQDYAKRFATLKAAVNGLDFADLEQHALRLLETHPDVRRRARDQFDYILMDELQDTNPLQWRIVDMVRREDRFFAVGDINQSIYGFRHADPSLFRRYREGLRDGGKRIDELRENYRTEAAILAFASAVIQGRPGIENPKFAAQKNSAAPDVLLVEVTIAFGEDKAMAEETEARWIAARIHELLRTREFKPEEIAVLARKTAPLGDIERALRRIGIPSHVIGGKGFYAAREVRDLIHLLGAIGNVHDEISMAGLLRSPLVGISDETLFRWKLRGRLASAIADPSGAASAMPAREDRDRWQWFAGLLRELRANRNGVSPDRLLQRVLDESGCLSALEGRQRSNVATFLARLREELRTRPRSAGELAREARRWRDEVAEPDAPPAESEGAVSLMSVHKAKGLEFGAVFVAALHQGAGGQPPIRTSPRYGLGACWIDPATGKPVSDTVFARIAEEETAREQEEQWRLLYVAMTRAERRLILTYAASETGRDSAWSGLIGELCGVSNKALAERAEVRDIGGAAVRVTVTAAAPAPGDAGTVLYPAAMAETLRPPEVTGQHDSVIPVTAASEFLACPRKYYLGRYLGFSPEAPRRWPDVLGDEAEELAGRAGGYSADGNLEIGIQVHQLLAGAAVDRPAEEVVRLVERFQESAFWASLSAAQNVHREFDFVVELDGVVLRGQIDVWFEREGKLFLADYKTDSLDPDADRQRLAPYELQLCLYALALQRLRGRAPHGAWLCFLRAAKEIPVDLGPESLAAALQTLRALREAQESGVFPLNEGPQCARCAFHGALCPAGSSGRLATSPPSAGSWSD